VNELGELGELLVLSLVLDEVDSVLLLEDVTPKLLDVLVELFVLSLLLVD
jgi:hypothetical protein